LKGKKVELKGRDLERMGFKPGPIYKEIFEDILRNRLNNLISTKRDEIRYVKKTFERHLQMNS
jgi:tRNA nucleotidyltransferase (CCA-adding enzyme)